MAWIDTVPDGEADAELRDLYDHSLDPDYGLVDNIMTVHSMHPAGLRTHLELYREVMTGTATLRKVERELLALVVSKTNDCHY